MQKMKMDIKKYLGSPIGKNKEDQSSPGSHGRDLFCDKTNKEDRKDGHVKKAIHCLHIGIEPFPGKENKGSNKHGGKTDGNLESFGYPDKTRLGGRPSHSF